MRQFSLVTGLERRHRRYNKNQKGSGLLAHNKALSRMSSDEERMALAVLVQGVKDIIENNQKYIDFYDPEWGTVKAVDNALAFFEDEGVDIGSYAWYCGVVGIDPEHIRKAINAGDWGALTAFAKVNVH